MSCGVGLPQPSAHWNGDAIGASASQRSSLVTFVAVDVTRSVPEPPLRFLERVRDGRGREQEVEHAPDAVGLPDARPVLHLVVWHNRRSQPEQVVWDLLLVLRILEDVLRVLKDFRLLNVMNRLEPAVVAKRDVVR